uniref:Zinc knuckle CX2CX4HX4C n=1 Tax=Tanacetum cinerariifolium TaxID=118510 RepID=A0A699GZZ1_TANCI|nr:hypothetical protein [Tanacetum cinerariifolium]
MLDYYTCSMCMESYGRGSFARALIELDGTCGLKDKLVVVIPKSKGLGYRMDTIHVEYEWKPFRCDNCKIFGHSCDNFPQWASTKKARSKDEKQKDILDDVDGTRKNVMAPPRKTSIWSARKAGRNIAFSPVRKLHYFDGDVLEFANMDQVVEEDEHGNVSSEHD